MKILFQFITILIITEVIWTSIVASRLHTLMLKDMNKDTARLFLISLMILTVFLLSGIVYVSDPESDKRIVMMIASTMSAVYIGVAFTPSPTILGNFLRLD